MDPDGARDLHLGDTEDEKIEHLLLTFIKLGIVHDVQPKVSRRGRQRQLRPKGCGRNGWKRRFGCAERSRERYRSGDGAAMHWMDIVRFEPLTERLAEIDCELDQLAETAKTVDPDAHGLLDDMEDLVGDGFLRCQLYMIERKGERRGSSAFACGPRHNSHFVAQIVHSAGNYRKHHGEWPDDPTRWGHHELGTVAVFRDAGLVEPEYWLSNLLYHVTKPSPPRFSSLMPHLIEWREALDRLPQ